MKRIGFANVMFTLWDVTSEDVYSTVNGSHYRSGVKTNYSYLGNLSKTETLAIEKAKLRGCTDLVPDTDLRGKSRSFSVLEKIDYEPFQFKYGKYESMDIRESDDSDYLLWYFNGCPTESNDIVKDRILELLPNHKFEGGVFYTDEQIARNEVYTRMCNGEIELTATSNFADFEQHWRLFVTFDPTTEAEESLLNERRNQWGVQMYVSKISLDLQAKWYNGTTYYTPDGMRSFKGKKFRIKDESIIYS